MAQRKLLSCGFWLYAISLVPSMILTVDWREATTALMPIAMIGWLLKISGMSFILLAIVKAKAFNKSFSGWTKVFLRISFLSLILKIIVEIGNTVPLFMDVTMYSRNLTIGYLHLGLIGFVSFALLAFFIKVNWIDSRQSFAFITILSGFMIYEALLFGDGLFTFITKQALPSINIWLFIASLIPSVGTLLLLRKRKA